MDKEQIKWVNNYICYQLKHIEWSEGDLGDIGNEIGNALVSSLIGLDIELNIDEFISGIKHGISLVDGSH